MWANGARRGVGVPAGGGGAPSLALCLREMLMSRSAMALPRDMVNRCRHGHPAIRLAHRSLRSFPSVAGPSNPVSGRFNVSALRGISRAKVGSLLEWPTLPLLRLRPDVQHLHGHPPVLPEASRSVAAVPLVRRRSVDGAENGVDSRCRQEHSFALETSSARALARDTGTETQGPGRGRRVLHPSFCQGQPLPLASIPAPWRGLDVSLSPDRPGDGGRRLGATGCHGPGNAPAVPFGRAGIRVGREPDARTSL